MNSILSISYSKKNVLPYTPSFNLTLQLLYEESVKLDTSQSILFLQILCFGVQILPSLFGNIIMLYIFFKNPSLRTCNNMFIINHGVIDICITLFTVPSWIIITIKNGNVDNCQFIAFINVVLILSSVYALATISLDRYFTICQPFTYPRIMNKYKVLWCIFIIWISSFALAIPPLFEWGRYSCHMNLVSLPGPQWNKSQTYGIFLLYIGFIIPLSMIIFSYVKIVKVAHEHAGRITKIRFKTPHDEDSEYHTQQSSSKTAWFKNRLSQEISYERMKGAHHANKEKVKFKTLKTASIIIGTFLCCWMPYVLFTLTAPHQKLQSNYWCDFFFTFFIMLNSAFNPYIFMFLHRDFQFTFQLTVAKLKDKIFPGSKDAVCKVRMSFYGDSICESQKVISKISIPSAIEMDLVANQNDSSQTKGMNQIYDDEDHTSYRSEQIDFHIEKESHGLLHELELSEININQNPTVEIPDHDIISHTINQSNTDFYIEDTFINRTNII